MFDAYTGPWEFAQAAHLLRRTIYGPTKERINQAIDEGLEGSIKRLLSEPEPVEPPIYYDFDKDPLAGIGETWVDKPIPSGVNNVGFERHKTIWSWWFLQMRRNQQTLTEKLMVFWHNHFVISESGNANMNWNYLSLLKEYALGDFRELTKRITIDQSMLIYLNGTQNVKEEPNENYARELLELFTIGKGPLVEEGDYTNYTEEDIAAIAKALTGWVAWNGTTYESRFDNGRHDTSSKRLSHRFANKQIENGGPDEYKQVVDIIFEQDEVSRHLCRRLYIWFVHYKISPEVEAGVIEPMAAILRENNYVVKPALEALFRSQHFYDKQVQGSMIKNTFDYFFSIFNTLHVQPPPDHYKENKMWLSWYWEMRKLDMAFFKIPSVAGWRAYYQEPIFYRDWVNSASLTLRKKMREKINGLINYIDEGHKGMDFLKFIETLDDPLDVNNLIDEICLLLFPRPMSQDQKDFFKDRLIPGLPDFEWAVEYGDYLSDPEDESKKRSVERKLEQMFNAMFGVPEFHLS